MNINKTWPSYIIVMVKYDIILLIHTVYSSCLVSQEEFGKLWTRLESFFFHILTSTIWSDYPFLILIEIIYIIPTTRHRLHESVSLIGTITFYFAPSTYASHSRHDFLYKIRVIITLPNSEQSYKGKVKTHKYINRQNQSTTGKLWKP